MFRICKLVLSNESKTKIQEYKLGDVTYIFGPNSIGKTLFAECIDFILGTSDGDLLNQDGMDHISEISACISNKNIKLWIKRDISSNFYYKLSENDTYNLVSRESYIEEISKIILPRLEDNRQLEVYQNVFAETPTFRAFTFLNFISESHQGDLKQIFTKGDELKNVIRIKKIMTFFFNYKNIEAISRKKEELNKNKKEYDLLSKQQAEYQYILNKIKNGFKKLNLKFTGKNDVDKKTLQNFKRNFEREKPESSEDLIYLSQASFSLSEELKQYNFLAQQSKKAKKRKINDEALLKLLDALIIENPKTSKYLEYIQEEIKNIQNEKALLSLANYDSAIKQIQKEKKKIDSQLEDIKSQANELEYDTTKQQILVLEQIMSDFVNFTNSDRIQKLEEENNQIRKEIRDLQEQFDKENLNKFNQDLLNMYFDEQIVKNINYVREDKEADGFSFSFSPLTQSLTVKKNDKVDSNHEKVQISFIPGSLARRTHIQILVYVLMLKYVIDNFSTMRVLPILVIDSADQAFQVENFSFLYPEITKFVKNSGIQLIFISKEKTQGIENVIKLEGGFNPFHDK